MIGFRRAHPALAKGDLTDLKSEGTVILFVRSTADERLFFALNLSDTPANIDAPEGNWHGVGGELGSTGPGSDGRLHLGPWQPCLMLAENT